MGTEKLLSTRGCVTELCKLAEHYGTDKLGYYTPFYDLIFRDRRAQIGKVLEVGIGTPKAMNHITDYRPGASLRMWRDYFPYAEIIGIDKDITACEEATEPKNRILTLCVDSTKPLDIEPDGLGYFDLIIDDGSHDPRDQINTFENLSPLLDDDGLYIIEDVLASADFSSLPSERTLFFHRHGDYMGTGILIRGEVING